mmetsp:Transcript_22537/g.33605  ORF Transcript_22537/g.33605 Transcript_22537/m.33605 type:complete len:103 (+) Transcript_22537:569-877(+)
MAMIFYHATSIFDSGYDIVNNIINRLDRCHQNSPTGATFESNWRVLIDHLNQFLSLDSRLKQIYSTQQMEEGFLVNVFEFWKAIELNWDRMKRHGVCNSPAN